MEDRYLFKAKRLDNGEWVKGALVYDDMDKLYRIITEIDYSTGTCITTDKAPRVDASTICQCTGLKDKNGKFTKRFGRITIISFSLGFALNLKYLKSMEKGIHIY